jgi:hypothetical protein
MVRKIIVVYNENININTVYKQSADFCDVKPCVAYDYHPFLNG